MLNLELGLHAEFGAFLDGEGLVLEVFEGAGRREFDEYIRTASHFEGETVNHAGARVGRVGGIGGIGSDA